MNQSLLVQYSSEIRSHGGPTPAEFISSQQLHVAVTLEGMLRHVCLYY